MAIDPANDSGPPLGGWISHSCSKRLQNDKREKTNAQWEGRFVRHWMKEFGREIEQDNFPEHNGGYFM